MKYKNGNAPRIGDRISTLIDGHVVTGSVIEIISGQRHHQLQVRINEAQIVAWTAENCDQVEDTAQVQSAA